MGQGLHTKILAIAASELGIDPEMIRVTATHTGKVPNTSATAASSGTDLNGMAVKNAIGILKERLTKVYTGMINPAGKITTEDLCFKNNQVYFTHLPGSEVAFKELIDRAYHVQTSLSATGFYCTPGLHFDSEKGAGNPFHYFVYGMAVTEAEVDLLTGSHRIIRTDILHDAGQPINPSLDLGQVAGGFVQGSGWVTTEVCIWDENGFLLNHSPGTYKIPTARDIPEDFRIKLLEGYPNEHTIKQSKAVGEPPLLLAISVWLAIRDAISASGDHKYEPLLNIPASNDAILKAIHDIRKRETPGG
jgi:xanthine dehydrogenase molybdopterin-binding subunit B